MAYSYFEESVFDVLSGIHQSDFRSSKEYYIQYWKTAHRFTWTTLEIKDNETIFIKKYSREELVNPKYSKMSPAEQVSFLSELTGPFLEEWTQILFQNRFQIKYWVADDVEGICEVPVVVLHLFQARVADIRDDFGEELIAVTFQVPVWTIPNDDGVITHDFYMSTSGYGSPEICIHFQDGNTYDQTRFELIRLPEW